VRWRLKGWKRRRRGEKRMTREAEEDDDDGGGIKSTPTAASFPRAVHGDRRGEAIEAC